MQIIQLLDTNQHTETGVNHDQILYERFHKFLNKALQIFCNKRDSLRTSVEEIQLSEYAWNSAPVIGTNTPRSLIVKGRENHFPIDYSRSL